MQAARIGKACMNRSIRKAVSKNLVRREHLCSDASCPDWQGLHEPQHPKSGIKKLGAQRAPLI